MKIIKRCALFSIFFAKITIVFGLNLNGRTTDEKGEALPFVSIYVKGTTNGTISNMDGRYQLELKPGNYEVIYKMIGYAMHIETIQINNENRTINV